MKPTLLPPMLKIGDTIGVIAPAGVINKETFTKGIAELKRLGYQVKYSPSIFDCDRYNAGTIERRAAEFNEMLLDKNVKAIFAVRGGYGSMQLLGRLDEKAIAAGPKIIMGYSDITALQIGLYQKYSWVTFHGPMVSKDFGGEAGSYDKRSFIKLLTHPMPGGPVNSHSTQVLVPGVARGRLLGGCLSLIIALMGTPWELDTDGAILFLEDINEKPYQIDRMLTQLRLAGKFRNVKAIIFGEMPGCQVEKDLGYSLPDLLKDLTKDLQIPVIYGLHAGHSDIGNLTLAFGVEVSLNERGILSFNEPAVDLTI